MKLVRGWNSHRNEWIYEIDYVNNQWMYWMNSSCKYVFEKKEVEFKVGENCWKNVWAEDFEEEVEL